MTISRRKQLTEEMKAAVRSAAASLFAEKGYHSVTIREIAKEAGCSHTAIYLYFKNKEDLLQQIAIPPLLELEQRLLAQPKNIETIDQILAACREYVTFCLKNGSFQTVLFSSASVRVDVEEPELEVNRIRNRLFSYIMSLLQEAIQTSDSERALNNGRVLVYYLQGFIHTYTDHTEPTELLLERVLPIFNDGIRILIAGMRTHN